jgi:hypothetical protein
MSLSSGIDQNNNDPVYRGKFYPDLIPFGHPPAQQGLGSVLQVNSSAFIPGTTTKQDATDFDVLGCVKIETGTVGMGNQPALVIGEIGDILQIKGATQLGSILVGNGVNTETLPVGANGLVLKANSGSLTGLGVEWAVDGTSGITGVSAGANISIDNTAPLVPVISVADPLTSQLNIGSQTIVGATTALTQTTTLDINANSAVAGLVELDFNDVAVPKSISAFNNIRISNIEAGAVMKFDTNDTGTGEIKTALKEETIKENEHEISITIVDTGGITNGEITRTIITSGDDTGCEDTITSTDNTNNRVALRKEETDWANGIVDTTTYTNQYLTNTTTSRVEIANNTEVSDTLSFTNGVQTGSYLNKATASTSRVDVGFTNTSGVGSTSVLLCDITQGQHTISYDGGATLLNSITNTTDTNRSRSEVLLSDGTVNQRNRIDATGLSCIYEQFSQNILGANNTTSLTTNATTPLTTLTTDAPLTLSTSGGNLNVSASNIAGIAGQFITLTSSGAGGVQVSAPAGTITSTSQSGQQVIVSSANSVSTPTLTITNNNASIASYPVIKTDRPTPVSVAGDVIGAISTWADDGAGTSREWSRIQTKTENVGVGNQDATLSIFNSVNGTVSETFNFNGAQNENNSFRILDMNNNAIRTSSGDMSITSATSSGTGRMTLQSKEKLILSAEPTHAVELNGNSIEITSISALLPSAGSPSGSFLQVRVNGTFYAIQLLNP